ncbi:unnamed protein product, partial [Rotaria sp. Silwood1]
DQYMQTRSILDKSLNNFFLNIERLGTRDLLSYAQLSYDTILISIQSNTKLPLTVNSLFSSHGLDLTSSLQILIELYIHLYILRIYFHQLYLYDLFDELIILLISYNLCKSGILLQQTTKQYNQLYIRLIEYNYKLTNIHAYTSCLLK